MSISENVATWIFIALVVLSVILFVYNYQLYGENPREVEYNLLKQYLVNESSLAKSDKPILWIHNAYEKNDRNWLDFGARNSNELNKPVIYLTVQSIITKCDRSFRICLIDDNSFMNLIPGWNIDFDKISEPSKSYYREIAQLHLLHTYGGMRVPSSLLCLENLATCYEKMSGEKDVFFCTTRQSDSVLGNTVVNTPSLNVVGSVKQNASILSLVKTLEKMVMRDTTGEIAFEGNFEKVVQKFIEDDKCKTIDGRAFGYFNKTGQHVNIDEWMSDEPIEMSEQLIGVDFPVDKIINSKHHNWCSNLSVDDLVEMNNNIGYMLNQVYCDEVEK
jgi:hypothetical protein